jgi:hypothetical protein
MVDTWITAVIVQYHICQMGFADLTVQTLEFAARGVGELTILEMLATLAIVSAGLIVVIGEGLVSYSPGFMLIEVLLPSVCVAIVGILGLLPIRVMIATANCIKFPPLRTRRAVRRLSAR